MDSNWGVFGGPVTLFSCQMGAYGRMQLCVDEQKAVKQQQLLDYLKI
jgi:hypothetical protein